MRIAPETIQYTFSPYTILVGKNIEMERFIQGQ